MRLQLNIPLLMAVAVSASGAGVQASLLGCNEPLLKDLQPDIAFYVSFDDESGDADLSVGDNKAKVEGKPVFEAGMSGKAFCGGNFKYLVKDNFQIDRPGSLSFWLCPRHWVRGNEEPLLQFFMTDYKGDGFLGLERQGQIIKDGRLARAPGLLMWFHYFKDIPPQSPMVTCDWKDGEWHSIVVTWRGPKWELLVDGKSQFVVELPRALKQEELSQYFNVTGNALIDEFAIYRRPLNPEEIRKIGEPKSYNP